MALKIEVISHGPGYLILDNQARGGSYPSCLLHWNINIKWQISDLLLRGENTEWWLIIKMLIHQYQYSNKKKHLTVCQQWWTSQVSYYHDPQRQSIILQTFWYVWRDHRLFCPLSIRQIQRLPVLGNLLSCLNFGSFASEDRFKAWVSVVPRSDNTMLCRSPAKYL